MVVANDKAPGPATSPEMLPTSFSIGMNLLKRLDDGSRHGTSGLNDCSLVGGSGVRVFRFPKENARGQNMKYSFGASSIDRDCSQWIHFSTSKGVDEALARLYLGRPGVRRRHHAAARSVEGQEVVRPHQQQRPAKRDDDAPSSHAEDRNLASLSYRSAGRGEGCPDAGKTPEKVSQRSVVPWSFDGSSIGLGNRRGVVLAAALEKFDVTE
jgi:hypothetical protein